MEPGEELAAVVEDTATHSEKDELTPEQYQRLKDAVFGETFRKIVFSDRSYFVLGSYGEAEKRRVDLVKSHLNDRPGSYAFLMTEVPDAWEFWTTKFKILADRADYVVGVFEHTHGGHEWEAGYLDQPVYRRTLYVLKREYETEAEEREAFDGMFAHFVTLLDDQFGNVYRWRNDDELREQLENVP